MILRGRSTRHQRSLSKQTFRQHASLMVSPPCVRRSGRRFAPRRCHAMNRHTRNTRSDRRHALGEIAVHANDGFVAWLQWIHYCGLHPTRAASRNRKGQAVFGLEGPAKQRLHFAYRLCKPRIQMADQRRRQGSIDTRILMFSHLSSQKRWSQKSSSLRSEQARESLDCEPRAFLELNRKPQACVVCINDSPHRHLVLPSAELHQDCRAGQQLNLSCEETCRADIQEPSRKVAAEEQQSASTGYVVRFRLTNQGTRAAFYPVRPGSNVPVGHVVYRTSGASEWMALPWSPTSIPSSQPVDQSFAWIEMPPGALRSGISRSPQQLHQRWPRRAVSTVAGRRQTLPAGRARIRSREYSAEHHRKYRCLYLCKDERYRSFHPFFSAARALMPCSSRSCWTATEQLPPARSHPPRSHCKS